MKRGAVILFLFITINGFCQFNPKPSSISYNLSIGVLNNMSAIPLVGNKIINNGAYGHGIMKVKKSEILEYEKRKRTLWPNNQLNVDLAWKLKEEVSLTVSSNYSYQQYEYNGNSDFKGINSIRFEGLIKINNFYRQHLQPIIYHLHAAGLNVGLNINRHVNNWYLALENGVGINYLIFGAGYFQIEYLDDDSNRAVFYQAGKANLKTSQIEKLQYKIYNQIGFNRKINHQMDLLLGIQNTIFLNNYVDKKLPNKSAANGFYLLGLQVGVKRYFK